MTIKPRTVRALRDARVRLRDAAAAAHAHAIANHEQAARDLSDEEDTLDDFLDEAATTIADARSVDTLDQVSEITGVHRLQVADARARHDEAAIASRDSEVRLRATAQKLRTAEKLVERSEHHVSSREARAEQRATDDLAARRRA